MRMSLNVLALLVLTSCGLEGAEWVPVYNSYEQEVAQVAARIVRTFDHDENGAISPREWGDRPFPLTMDLNRDLAIDASEYAAHLARKDAQLASLPHTEGNRVSGFAFVFPDQQGIDQKDLALVKNGLNALTKAFPRALSMLRNTQTVRFGKGVKVRFIADDPKTPTYGITDHPDFYHLRGKKTFDGRLWDEVEGVADPDGRTGVTVRDLGRGHSGEQVNTFMHEFGHTTHQFVMDSRTEARVVGLYEAAKARGVFLDPYAGSNVYEYWAQGVEAYLLLVPKQGSPGDSHDNTPEELKREDPDLFDYLESLFEAR